MVLRRNARKEQTRNLNALIDRALREPSETLIGQVARLRTARQPAALAERIRRRATLLCRRYREYTAQILEARDALILAIYAAAAPVGWFCAWCDGSVFEAADTSRAGIGGLIMDPDGHLVAQLKQPSTEPDAFAAEVAALEAILKAANERGIKHLRVHTDCPALAVLWRTHRDDPRLTSIRSLVRALRHFDLRDVPRLHNQPADRLARDAALSGH